VNTVEVEGLLIDEDTGEVLDWPEGVTGDRFEWIKSRMIEANAQKTRWDQLCGYYKQALGRMLDEMGVKKHEGVQWVAPQERPWIDPVKLGVWLSETEVPIPMRLAVYDRATKALDAGIVRDMLPDLDIIEYKASKPYIRFDTPQRAAPEIRRNG
jgi:hypothetical protein